MKRGDILELQVEKYAFEGKGVARIFKEGNGENKSGYVVFVNGGYPGDKVQARILKTRKSYAEASVEKIISPSSERIKANCKYFGECGGCRQQDLEYSFQTRYKQQQVKEIFEKMGGLSEFEIENIIPSEKIFYYRNKMEFSFTEKRWLTKEEIKSASQLDKDFALGLHVPAVYDKVLDIDECFLQSELSNDILNFSRKFFKERNTSVYSTQSHKGFLRNLVIKQSQGTKEVMVNLVTSSENDEIMKEYTDSLKNNFTRVTTIINNINLKKAAVAIGDYEKVYFGEGFIYDYIGKHKFRISANSFFQTNTLQAEKLYDTVLEFSDLKEDEIIYDLYSGAGTIAIYLSDKVKEVYAFESVESAIKDAKENTVLNKINNVRFITADLYKSFLPLTEKNNLPTPDKIIIDPPRSGMHKNTVDDVIKLNPGRIVYVSCNPATQVRDIKMLVETGYSLIKIRPVDMFPHTYHIENVSVLRKD
ncbi:MAG TPA: 23S rRNA (uracil(1939)-C(5))-methyltransferase RlmD [Ignavibacteriaceae bacterium]|nr:23S rRNA (uracil(1939)-C(5))-methyltransferase RlmD [Ignavibacteriaceae bacterium]